MPTLSSVAFMGFTIKDPDWEAKGKSKEMINHIIDDAKSKEYKYLFYSTDRRNSIVKEFENQGATYHVSQGVSVVLPLGKYNAKFLSED